MNIFPVIKIKSTIHCGSVYLFRENSFDECEKKHYFIVLNSDPLFDGLLFLVWAKTLSEKVYLYIDSCSLPKETFVDITKQCDWCQNPTVVDCNKIIEKEIGELAELLNNNKLKIIGDVGSDILNRLITGVNKSPLVERRIKKMLKVIV